MKSLARCSHGTDQQTWTDFACQVVKDELIRAMKESNSSMRLDSLVLMRHLAENFVEAKMFQQLAPEFCPLFLSCCSDTYYKSIAQALRAIGAFVYTLRPTPEQASTELKEMIPVFEDSILNFLSRVAQHREHCPFEKLRQDGQTGALSSMCARDLLTQAAVQHFLESVRKTAGNASPEVIHQCELSLLALGETGKHGSRSLAEHLKPHVGRVLPILQQYADSQEARWGEMCSSKLESWRMRAAAVASVRFAAAKHCQEALLQCLGDEELQDSTALILERIKDDSKQRPELIREVIALEVQERLSTAQHAD
eukprot:Skav200616  [mRNA]  locus=scaffold4360:17183:36587:- [translate_table: standard]